MMVTTNAYLEFIWEPQKVPINPPRWCANRRSRPAAHAITRLSRGRGNGRLSGKTTSQSTIRKEAIVGLKLTIRFCLLGSCAFCCLRQPAGTSSKTSRRNSSLTNKKAPAAKVAVAGSSSDSKNEQRHNHQTPLRLRRKPLRWRQEKPPGRRRRRPSLTCRPVFRTGFFAQSRPRSGRHELIIRSLQAVLATKSVVLQYRPSGTGPLCLQPTRTTRNGLVRCKDPGH